MDYTILKAIWDERDRRYYGARPITENQVIAVVEWRLKEADDLEDGPDRDLAIATARKWKPPQTKSQREWRPTY